MSVRALIWIELLLPGVHVSRPPALSVMGTQGLVPKTLDVPSCTVALVTERLELLAIALFNTRAPLPEMVPA